MSTYSVNFLNASSGWKFAIPHTVSVRDVSNFSKVLIVCFLEIQQTNCPVSIFEFISHRYYLHGFVSIAPETITNRNESNASSESKIDPTFSCVSRNLSSFGHCISCFEIIADNLSYAFWIMICKNDVIMQSMYVRNLKRSHFSIIILTKRSRKSTNLDR